MFQALRLLVRAQGIIKDPIGCIENTSRIYFSGAEALDH